MNKAVLNQPSKQCITKVGLLFIFIYGRFHDNSKSEISAFSDSLKYGNLTRKHKQFCARKFDHQDKNPRRKMKKMARGELMR